MEFWFSEMHTPHVKFSIRVDRQLYSGKSEFQRIDVFDSPEFGRFLTLDGYMMLTEKDEFIYHEMITHVPMAVHPHVEKVLVIGAGTGASSGSWPSTGHPAHRHGGDRPPGGGGVQKVPAPDRLPPGRCEAFHPLRGRVEVRPL